MFRCVLPYWLLLSNFKLSLVWRSRFVGCGAFLSTGAGGLNASSRIARCGSHSFRLLLRSYDLLLIQGVRRCGRHLFTRRLPGSPAGTPPSSPPPSTR